MKKFLTMIIIMIMIISVVGCAVLFTGCQDTVDNGGNDNKEPTKYYNNASDPLMFSTQNVDGVFNPFFATSGPDSNIVGMTQLGMLSNDGEGNPLYGENEATVVLDYEEIYDEKKDTTTYYFVLKNNVKYSNGSPLTMKDVLFNLYVYLDQAYTGSATIYSTKIIGLQEYRTQQASEEEQKNFITRFETEAEARIDELETAFKAIKDDEGSNFVTNDEESFRNKLVDYVNNNALTNSKILDDYDRVRTLFKEELEKDFNNSKDTFEDIIFTDEKGNNHKDLFTTDVEAFLYNEGYYKWDKKNAVLSCSLVNDIAEIKDWKQEKAIQTVYDSKMPTALDEIITYWATATELFDYLTKEGMEKYFESIEGTGYQNISGIKFANKDNAVTVKGKEYAVPTYESANYGGAVTSGNEVLSIEIEKVDPKAIWNFAFAVAPMYYYSNAEQIALFDYESHFGVVRGSQDFMNDVVKHPDKVGVPVGAGPYMASKQSGGTDNVESGDFKANNVIYFEANPNYIVGEPLIKKVRYQVISNAQILTTLYTGAIDFVEPNANPDVIKELNGKRSEGIGNKDIPTLGYGYIGINAAKVPSIKVRQAIMHSINTKLCIDYYKNKAEQIHRSMSKESWAYPDDCTAYYPYIGDPIPENLDVVNPDYRKYVEGLGKSAGDTLTPQEQSDFITGLVEGDSYRVNANGVYQKGSNVLKYTFTIAGQEEDHPAFKALYQAGTFLNKNGFEIVTTTDAQALSKLSSGGLTVWAAAWGSTLDPDMYQVYHKDSKATSTLNWGYKAILSNKGGEYDDELALVGDLSELIDQAREITDQDKRAEIYSDALDLVMELAIELPTYQRNDLFAYNINKIDESTFNQTPTSFKGLTSDIHTLSLIVEK